MTDLLHQSLITWSLLCNHPCTANSLVPADDIHGCFTFSANVIAGWGMVYEWTVEWVVIRAAATTVRSLAFTAFHWALDCGYLLAMLLVLTSCLLPTIWQPLPQDWVMFVIYSSDQPTPYLIDDEVPYRNNDCESPMKLPSVDEGTATSLQSSHRVSPESLWWTLLIHLNQRFPHRHTTQCSHVLLNQTPLQCSHVHGVLLESEDLQDGKCLILSHCIRTMLML